MSTDSDHSNAMVRPPLAWALAFVAGLVADRVYPIPLYPTSAHRGWIGGTLFAAGFVLAVWAILTIRKAGSRVETSKPTTTIVEGGPFRFSRNPVYLGMLLGQTGLAVSFDSAWILAMLVPFYVVIRYGVIAREERYLERKFGNAYLAYKSRVRRWL